MYLHIGQDTVVKTDEIIGIFDLDTSTVSKRTRDFLAAAEISGRVKSVSSELPKAFVVCQKNNGEIIYLTAISSKTLIKRKENLRKDMILW